MTGPPISPASCAHLIDLAREYSCCVDFWKVLYVAICTFRMMLSSAPHQSRLSMLLPANAAATLRLLELQPDEGKGKSLRPLFHRFNLVAIVDA